MWSSILRYSTTSYLNYSITTVLNLRLIRDLDTQSVVITAVTALYVLIWPFIIYKILKANDLAKPEIKVQIGSLYMNYETDKQSVYHFTAFFLYRRLIFAIVLLVPLFA
jgi:hypothetical protein